MICDGSPSIDHFNGAFWNSTNCHTKTGTENGRACAANKNKLRLIKIFYANLAKAQNQANILGWQCRILRCANEHNFCHRQLAQKMKYSFDFTQVKSPSTSRYVCFRFRFLLPLIRPPLRLLSSSPTATIGNGRQYGGRLRVQSPPPNANEPTEISL